MIENTLFTLLTALATVYFIIGLGFSLYFGKSALQKLLMALFWPFIIISAWREAKRQEREANIKRLRQLGLKHGVKVHRKRDKEN